jgi:DNA polymerase-3 subunit alpha
MSVKELVARAKELGAPAVALTDHGVLTGFFEFMNACQKAEIKGIPGVEAYFCPDNDGDDELRVKNHLILMAKDITGYMAIAKAVTESNKHLSGGSNSVPRMDYKLLESFFGPKASGHGHVVATSACMNGVLARIILSDEAVFRESQKIRNKRDKYHPVDDEFLDAMKEKQDLEEELNALISERDELTASSKVNVSGMTRKLKTLEAGSEEAIGLTKEIASLQKSADEAAGKLTSAKNAVTNHRRKLTLANQKFKAIETQVNKWLEEDEKAQILEASAKSEDESYEEAKTAARKFEKTFGKGNFFVELQYHRVSSEARCMPILARLARELSLPVVAANDAHYAKPEGTRAREIVAALRFEQIITEEKEEGFGELYIKTDSELRNALLEILDKDVVDKAIAGITAIVDACDVQYEKRDHYPKYKNGEGEDSDPGKLLRELAEKGIAWRFPDGKDFTKEYRDRLEYELDVIGKSGYDDYLCIVQDFLNYGRTFAKDNEYGVGYTIGPGRGSAVGSLVCYLSGITSIDPMKYGLLFERFLNMERVSMPDIDSDFHTEIRSKVLDYVKGKYGEGAVASITTKSTMAAKLAVRNAARVTDVPLSVIDSITRQIPNKPGMTLKELPVEVEAMCNENPVINQLVKDARLVEGTVVNYGTHAAGVIISDNDDVSDYVALMYNPDKEQWAVQCDMGECEHDAGLLKMDFLGLRNIDVINDTVQKILTNKGVSIDIETVPFEPAVFASVFATGKTNSVFQFESSGMKEMLKKFRPSSIEDIILLVAAYRPGPMQYLESIISVKHNKETPEYIVPTLEPLLSGTYGKPIYQEQVMQIFNKVAGFTLGEADIIRRAMGKKKMEILTDPSTNYKGKFIDGLTASGATEEQAEAFWNELLDFANYAFNKSHATAYAFVSYYTAYLKYHYPAEFMCAVMARTERAKLPMLLAECREMGLSIQRPDINLSGDNFTNRGNDITFGFSSIKGVGNSGRDIIEERDVGGPFKSIKDLIARTVAGKGSKSLLNKTVVESLILSGALDDFCGGNRTSLLNTIEKLSETTKKLKNKEAELSEWQNELSEKKASGISEKELSALERKIKNSEKAVGTISAELREITFLPGNEDSREKLETEKELLGFYVSGHPLDGYEKAIKSSGATSLALVTDGNCKVCGLISELTIRQRKKDGAALAFFKLTDKSGDMEIKCWTKEYAEYRDIIDDGVIVVIEGYMKTERDVDEEGLETITDSGITVKKLKKLVLPNTSKILMSVPFIGVWVDEAYSKASKFADDDGCVLIVHDTLLDEMRESDFKVSEKILSASFGEGISLSKLA